MLFINKYLNGKTDPPVNSFICIYIFNRTDLSPALLIVYPFLCTEDLAALGYGLGTGLVCVRNVMECNF